ncbi:DUF1501 domain-containing protein [Schlesneria paludicola]|uniref:DUF1501 domain-containing protein n=1 Tax=Schlesneria paludicola TaxID=360056 RepID=UPI00029A2F85|nr:DUF1501 domain-containing protein [Schlesneria paludicola]
MPSLLRNLAGHAVSRRDCLAGLGAFLSVGASRSWLPLMAQDAAANPQRKRSCILLWMSGGPSQIDTFDMKPEHPNGGEFKEIETAVPGIRISEHLPKIAAWTKRMAIIRSMSTREGDHGRATHLIHTGYVPQGPINYPTLGSLLSKELGQASAELPNFVSILPQRFASPAAFGPGFLGSKYAPMTVGSNAFVGNGVSLSDYDRTLQVENLQTPRHVSVAQRDRRLQLLQGVEQAFQNDRPEVPIVSHAAAYEQAVRLMKSSAVEAFGFGGETDAVRERYGKSSFGQSCLLARRLVERGVPFVDVTLSAVQADNMFANWDSHQNNFRSVKALSEVLDTGWSALMEDLESRGLLDSTLVVWMGEFGRTPVVNSIGGRDHFPAAWSTVLCGGGIRGGQVVGRTTGDGMKVQDRPVTEADLLGTICLALGLDSEKQNMSNVGRPIRLVDPKASPIREVVL